MAFTFKLEHADGKPADPPATRRALGGLVDGFVRLSHRPEVFLARLLECPRLRLIRNAFHLHPLAGGGRSEATNDVSVWIENGHSSDGCKRLAILREPPRAGAAARRPQRDHVAATRSISVRAY
jgi:hypothetical protein